jgi:heme-degrading monooxygenase HmoA
MLQPRPIDGESRAPWPMAAATLGAWSLARLCDELQVEFEVALFNRAFAARPDDTEAAFIERAYSTRGALRRSQGSHADRLTSTVNHYLVKAFDQRWQAAEDQLAGLFWTASHPAEAATEARRDPREAPPVSMFEKAANVDEFNVVHAAQRLARRNTQVRLLVTLADGMTRGSVEALAAAVDEAEMEGTVVLGIGIGDDTVAAAYSRHRVVERPDGLARAMVDGVRAALRRSIALTGGDTWWAHESRLYDEPEPRRSRG